MIGFTLDEAFARVGMFLYPQASLKNCYDQAHRHYHNLEHLKEMLRWVPHNHNEVEIILDAILFHDIVHLPTPTPTGLNETLSVAEYILYTTKLLAFDTPFGNNEENFEYEKRVIEAITATSRHNEDQHFLGDVTKLVLDLDLSTFALPWEEYCIWKERIEKENLEMWNKHYKPEEIRKGRGLFLQALLKRKRLYYLKTEWEEKARENINRDIELL